MQTTRLLTGGVVVLVLAAASFGVRAQPASAPLPDGVWTVNGSAIPGMRCGDWFVRLRSVQGRLSGTVGLTQASLPIHDLRLFPDGTFAGATRPAVRALSPYEVSGRFDGDTVSITLQTNACPIRGGRAARQEVAAYNPGPPTRSPY